MQNGNIETKRQAHGFTATSIDSFLAKPALDDFIAMSPTDLSHHRFIAPTISPTYSVCTFPFVSGFA